MDPRPDTLPISEEEARVTHLRASMARMVRSSVAAAHDLEAWTARLASLPPDVRALAEADQALPEWVPIEVIMAWIKAFASPGGQVDRGIRLADQLLDHAHPWIQRALDPALAVEAMPRVYQHYHRGGVSRLEDLSPSRAVLDLWAFVPYPGWYDVLLPTVFKRAVERCGAADVRVVILPHPPGDPFYHHRYDVTWDAHP